MRTGRPRYTLRALFIATTIIAVSLSCYVYRIAIWAHLYYGPRVNAEAVDVLAVDSGAYILRIAGKNVLTEKAFGLLDADADSTSARINGVWKTRQGATPYVVRVGDEFLDADYCGPE